MELERKEELKAGMGEEKMGKERDSNGEGGRAGGKEKKRGETNGT